MRYIGVVVLRRFPVDTDGLRIVGQARVTEKTPKDNKQGFHCSHHTIEVDAHVNRNGGGIIKLTENDVIRKLMQKLAQNGFSIEQVAAARDAINYLS